MYNDKDIKLFDKDLIDISLKACRCICQFKKHHLVLEMVILSPKHFFPFVSLADSHPMIYTGKIKLGKLPSSFQLI